MRRSPIRRRKGSTSYSRRERDLAFMGWTKQQPCMVRVMPPQFFTSSPAARTRPATPCYGEVEADHMGDRGLGQKADDTTTVPMCTGHHAERTDHRGAFRTLNREEVRTWRALAIAHTQAEWAARSQQP